MGFVVRSGDREPARCSLHLAARPLLTTLLRLPFCFNPLQVLRFDGLVPVRTIITLFLLPRAVASFHRVLLRGGWCVLTIICFRFALALSGSSPCFPRPSYRLGSCRLPGSVIVMLYIEYTLIEV